MVETPQNKTKKIWKNSSGTKPDARQFKKIAMACAIGFAIMGFIGYMVKLVFIPINNIIVGM